jgi:predicted DNA-binding protein with PD1-like motif
MFSREVRTSRQVVGRIHRGRRLQEALQELAVQRGLTAGWISALGAFEWIDVTEYCQATQTYEEAHRFERCELLSMVGNLSMKDGEPFWHLHATISRRENGQEVVYGGHVADAQIFALEFRVECLDDVQLARSLDEPTGLHLWAEPTAQTDSSASPTASSAVSEPAIPSAWARVAAVSAEATKPEKTVEYKPERGDWIDHPKFGLCKLEGLSGAGVGIIRLPDGLRKKIHFSVLRVLAPRQDGERRIFPVTPKRKG